VHPLITQLQGLLGGRRVMSGGVTSGGAVSYGSGFTVASHPSTGVYVIAFDRPHPDQPVVHIGSDASVALPRSYPTGVSVSGFTANIKDNSGSLVDAAWNFASTG
jgi:hypothetical protein